MGMNSTNDLNGNNGNSDSNKLWIIGLVLGVINLLWLIAITTYICCKMKIFSVKKRGKNNYQTV